jgi:hypothetical protein
MAKDYMSYIRSICKKVTVNKTVRLYRGNFSKLFETGDVLWVDDNIIYSDTGLMIDMDFFYKNVSSMTF